MRLVGSQSVTITTTGENGSATGSGRIWVPEGQIYKIALDYSASAPGTTDLTIAHSDSRFGNIIVVTDSVTDAVYHPTVAAHTAAAGAVTNGYLPCYVTEGWLTISVAGSNALAACVVVSILTLAFD